MDELKKMIQLFEELKTMTQVLEQLADHPLIRESYAALLMLENILRCVDGCEVGIFKRIDENRELLELLEAEVPTFLRDHSQVRNWLHSQDIFLTTLATITGSTNRFAGSGIPRAWPQETSG